jgi:hypothetical protein
MREIPIPQAMDVAFDYGDLLFSCHCILQALLEGLTKVSPHVTALMLPPIVSPALWDDAMCAIEHVFCQLDKIQILDLVSAVLCRSGFTW